MLAIMPRVYGADLSNLPGCWTCSGFTLFAYCSVRTDYASKASGMSNSSSDWPRCWRHQTSEIDENGFFETPIMGAVVSADGYIANTDGEVGPLFDWYGNGEVELEGTNARDREVRWLAGQARAPPPRSGARELYHGQPRGRPAMETKIYKEVEVSASVLTFSMSLDGWRSFG